ncbi:hypothetical protein FEM48_Zijuj01G0050000 [Ziziphus jujuba var. spinosa]|uniref:Uncharacterized protein n=1 Tax=Ziziphus jujuba var. spinosa TaxID=714518 RepID=A0A978VZ94_ZIZJJ|nr:hypothetical protein FEM48_Zijuj01G0050000 [Ziziphus jujuba var. spinosa]
MKSITYLCRIFILKGFRKIDPEQWEFANDDFIRGQPHLMKNIHRRKPVHSHSLPNSQGQGISPLTESERESLKDDIDRLKHDKENLVLELQRNEQEWKSLESQMEVLKESLQNMNRRQQSIVSFMTRILQKRGLPLSLVPQLETNDRKRRLPRIGYFCDEASIEDNQMAGSQSIPQENMDALSVMTSNIDQLDQLEASLTLWENMVQDVTDTCNQISSNVELDASTDCAESPGISCAQLNVDIRPKSPGIDMNSEPAVAIVPEVAASKEQISKEHVVGTATAAPAQTGVNDVFWEQFLTENPGASDAQEVQSERKDTGGRRNESKPVDHGKFWWGMRNVNNLTEQIGHLTPAEKT